MNGNRAITNLNIRRFQSLRDEINPIIWTININFTDDNNGDSQVEFDT